MVDQTQTFAADVAAFVMRHGPTEAARKLGTSTRNVERWADGTRSPRPAERVRVRALLEASRAAPVAEPTPPPNSAGPVNAHEDAVDDAEDDDDEDAAVIARRTVRILTGQLERLNADASATPRERAAVASALTGAVRLLARLEDEDALFRRVMKTHKWKSVWDTIMASFERWPDACRAAADALDQLDDRDRF